MIRQPPGREVALSGMVAPCLGTVPDAGAFWNGGRMASGAGKPSCSREGSQIDMRLPIKLSALLAMFLLAFTILGGTGVGAQDEPTGELLPEDIEGLQHGVVRAYSDYSALFASATPGTEPEVPSGVFLLGATILEFDSSDNAETALTQIAEDADAGGEAGLGGETEVSSIDLNLGENSIGYSGVEDLEGEQVETVIALVQEETYVYFVVASGSGENMQAITTEFANGLIENDGSGEGEFNEDGTSSGGLWDKYPAADEELITGLIPFDQVLFPVPESTPES